MSILRIFLNMDNESIRRLTALETKLDYLIEHSSSANQVVETVSNRVSKLESNHQWIAGGTAVLALLSGVLVIALRAHVEDLITNNHETTNYLVEVCKDIQETKVGVKEYLTLCYP